MPRVGATSGLRRCRQGDRPAASRRAELLSIAKVPPFPPDGHANVIPHLFAVDRSGQFSQPGIDTIVRRVAVSYMSRVLLAVVNAVQSRRNAANEEHEDRH